ncbi:kinase-like domain-containing protein [Rhizophagus clarus]|uniref:Kinase-like domain-containing protein n=1 Tax=Rhizophagus clarus TaxID=94130 RepID=A0A8H3LQ51_9GLOM|nr:kinase-like domain-containing protein [Rhizophagus clarus]
MYSNLSQIFTFGIYFRRDCMSIYLYVFVVIVLGMVEFGNSGNAVLDQFILNKRLKWIPYDRLTNVEYLNKGGFGTIYKATWLDKYRNSEVVLKCPNNLNHNLDEFLNEWKYHERCLKSPEIINLYGFTKNSDMDYMVVMDFANKGNLRGNLENIVKNDWREKLYTLYKIISGLNEVHNQYLIHCDFHDGNILIDGDKVYISDLGLCKSAISSSEKGVICGVVPFIAPEVLRGKPYTQAKLMKKCWNEDPFKRPSAPEVKGIIRNWIFRPNNGVINEELKSNIIEFINAPIVQLVTEDHPGAYFTSRLLDFTSVQLNEFMKKDNLNRLDVISESEFIYSFDIKIDEILLIMFVNNL